MRVDSQRGGAILYRVEILARYPAEGGIREQWTTTSQLPQLLAEAQCQTHLLDGKRFGELPWAVDCDGFTVTPESNDLWL